jgi:Zn-dependent M28 family amino/carboxypeptidase
MIPATLLSRELILWVAVLFVIGGCNVKLQGRAASGDLPALTVEETTLRDGLRAHVEMLGTTIGDRNVWRYEQLKASADYIERQLTSFGYKVARQPYTAGGKEVVNLEAELRGATRPDEIFIVGAHYDSVRGCPAANDNGSGVAGVLEIARLMAQANPARTVRFVLFVNEEPPFFQTDLMGSVVYSRRCKQRGEKVVGMISVETIGYYSDARGSQKYPPPYDKLFPSTGNYIAFVANADNREFAERVTVSFRKHSTFPYEGIAAPDGVEGVGWSDHWSFWQDGYPALMVTDTAPFRYPHYHHPTDTPDKIDYDRTARVVTGLEKVVRDLTGD